MKAEMMEVWEAIFAEGYFATHLEGNGYCMVRMIDKKGRVKSNGGRDDGGMGGHRRLSALPSI